MKSDITFGQYVEGDSLIHRLDPRVKIVAALFAIVSIFLAKSASAFLLLTVSSVVFVLMTGISPRLILRAMKPLVFIILFTAVINIFFMTGENVVFEFHFIRVYREGIVNACLIVLRILLLIVFLAQWEITARLGVVDAFVVSSPSRIVRTLGGLWQSGDLWRHLGVSCFETIVGFALGTLLGVFIAVLLWWSETLSRVLDPYLVVLNALPKTALGPIFIVWIGAGTESIIAMTIAISVFVTILNMYVAFCGIDREKLRLMQTLGASKWQTLRTLVIPGNYPALFNTMRVNVGLAWVGVIMGEFLVSKAGLGYLIVYGSQVFNMDLVMASVFLLAAAAVLMYQAVLLFERAAKQKMGVN